MGLWSSHADLWAYTWGDASFIAPGIPNQYVNIESFNGRMRDECWMTSACIAWHPCYHVIMIVSFKNSGTDDIFNGRNSNDARKTCPQSLWKVAARKLDQLDSVVVLEELKVPPGNRLEALSGDRQGEYSIRINDQYRVCFKWSEAGPFEVEITDYH